LFHEKYGAFHKDNGDGLGVQVVGALAIIAWTAAISFVLFGSLFLLKKIRMPAEVEVLGTEYADINWFGFGYKLKPEYALAESAGKPDQPSEQEAPEGNQEP
jgi:ammonia channel protein AmtB